MVLGIVVTLGLFIALLGALEIGRWAQRRIPHSESYDSTAADSVVFGILGLLIAFTFNSAASRFDERGNLINDQANALPRDGGVVGAELLGVRRLHSPKG